MLRSKTKNCIKHTLRSMQRRSACFRPQLVVLEDRLPPGDTVLGALMAQRLLEPRPLGPGRLSNSVAAVYRPSQQGADLRLAPAASTGPARLFVPSSHKPIGIPLSVQPASAALGSDLTPPWTESTDWADDPTQGVFPIQTGRSPVHRPALDEANSLHASTPAAGSAAVPDLIPVTGPAGQANTSSNPLQASEHSVSLPMVGSAPEADVQRLLAAASSGAHPLLGHGAVHALFHLDVQTEAPSPTNWFTVPDRSNLTGLRVNLPYPDCKVFVTDCEDLNLINQLDGFNMQPRLSIPFDGPIDVNSVTSQSVFLISLGDTVGHHDSGGQVVGINQIVWDPPSNTLHVQSDELLDQHTRYALILTNGLRSADGTPVEASEAFRNFRHDVRGEYKHELLDAIHAARRLGIRESDIVDASVFTTESATAVLEKIRDQIHAATPEPADFNLGPDGSRTVFNLDHVKGITFNEQDGDNPRHFTPVPLNVGLLHIIPGTIGEIAFGKYVSPDYEIHPGEYIPQVSTLTGTPVVHSMDDVYFNLFLPSGPKPEGGWPVAIFGHGGGSNKNDFGTFVAASMAAHGIAAIGINMPGNGFGPLGTLAVSQTDGGLVTLSAGGRSFDQDGDGGIDSQEGFFPAAPRQILWSRDSLQQAVADLMQLVRVIQVGINVTGDGNPDLDPSRIYYIGQSSGAQVGTILLAVEPDVPAGVINSGFGPSIEVQRLSYGQRTFRQTRIEPYLQARMPSLSNPPGITEIDGLPVGTGVFNENLPLRNGIPLEVRLADGTSQTIQSPVINTVAGAMEIQKVFDDTVWLSLSGEGLGYASHLRKSPLPGVPAKSVIILFGKGDETAPNPMETAVVRAGDLADRTTFYRNDLAFAEDDRVPKNPHRFMTDIFDPDPLAVQIALGAQQQIATFFASEGQTIIHPEPARFFEVPIQGPLPEDLNWIP